MRHLFRIPVLICLVAASCAEFMAPVGHPDEAAVAARKDKAEKLTRQGNLADALVEWKILETMTGGDPELARKRRAVQTNARRQAERHYNSGLSALAKRQTGKARRQFLATLALEPEHEEAIEELRKMEVRRVRADRPAVYSPAPRIPNRTKKQAAAKADVDFNARAGRTAESTSKAELQPPPPRKPDLRFETAPSPISASLARAIALAKQGAYKDSISHYESHLARYPKDKDATRLLAVSHREVGIALYNGGELRESLSHLEASAGPGVQKDRVVEAALTDAKSRLAQQAYEKGVRVFRRDIAQAIAHWEQSLSYDPDHVKARSYLDRAYKIQQTLNSLAQ